MPLYALDGRASLLESVVVLLAFLVRSLAKIVSRLSAGNGFFQRKRLCSVCECGPAGLGLFPRSAAYVSRVMRFLCDFHFVAKLFLHVAHLQAS